MQTLKDAATLAALILLALTLRVDFDGNPLKVDLNTPAVASTTDPAPVGAKPIEPAEMRDDVAMTPFGVYAKGLPAVELPRAPGRDTVQRRIIWQVDGKRFLIELGDDRSDPSGAVAPEPCHGPMDPKLAC